MKIRKILPLVLLAVVALFVLSSCDALLDAIFPAPSNTLYVTVPVTELNHTQWPFTSVTVYLYNAGNSLVAQQSATSTGNNGTTATYDFSFGKLANGTYTLEAVYPTSDPVSTYTYTFFDPNPPYGAITSISLPDANPSDSTGKTVTVTTATL